VYPVSLKRDWGPDSSRIRKGLQNLITSSQSVALLRHVRISVVQSRLMIRDRLAATFLLWRVCAEINVILTIGSRSHGMFRANQLILLQPHLAVGPLVNVPSPENRLYQDFYAKVLLSRFMYLDTLFRHSAVSCCMRGYLQVPRKSCRPVPPVICTVASYCTLLTDRAHSCCCSPRKRQ
jgi:hypothetical protein